MSFWQKFWTPDVEWLNTANMTNLRSLNATRLAVFLIAIGAVGFLGSTMMFWRSVWYATAVTDKEIVSAILMSGKEASAHASSVYEAMLWFAAAVGGFAITGAIGKRMTDTGHRVAVEQAKKAPVIVPGAVTSEHMAQQPPTQQMTVNVGSEEVAVEAQAPAKARPRPTGDARTDDERGEL